ncbi:MAG TPA: bacteriohemerythrin [Rhodospirillaceae bacterium]|nr:bacteriohemerythrin [Rhodospirillaceae bacterium]
MTAQALNAISVPAFIIDKNHKVLAWNRACELLTGIAAGTLLGTDLQWSGFYAEPRPCLADLVLENATDEIAEHYQRHGKAEFAFDAVKAEGWFESLNGKRRYLVFEARPLLSKGKVVGALEMLQDLTAFKEAEERISFLAHHDSLTGLPNRVLLEDRILQTIARARRDGEVFAVAFLDLDRFKQVNDALGHDLGDRLLREAATRLSSSVRGTDTVSRQGGDEFLLVLTGLQTPMDVAQVVKKILRSLREPYHLDNHSLSVTPSIGLSLYPADGDTAGELIKNADAAMYHAKASGRNNFQFYTERMNAEAVATLTIESSLKSGIPSQLFVEYQPQLNIATRSLLGAEALVRWQHPTLGLISPAKFIPMAEDSGMISDIGRYVLSQACALIRRTGLKVAVNLSALQLAEGDLVEHVAGALDGIGRGLLTLEITESAFIGDFENSKVVLERLKQLGIVLALDDFGTGYSSLSYLHRLPIDYLKIDQSFIRNDDARSIVLAIIGLADALGLATVAEGVETPEQMSFLERNGCSAIQGYYFSRPIREAKLMDFLEDHPVSHRTMPIHAAKNAEPYLSWSFTFATGITEMDRQHRHFVNIINLINLNQRDPARLADLFEELIAYSREHFAYEEELMVGLKDNLTIPHRAQHAAFTRQIERIRQQLAAGEGHRFEGRLAAITREWLSNHILTTDLKLAAALKRRAHSSSLKKSVSG